METGPCFVAPQAGGDARTAKVIGVLYLMVCVIIRISRNRNMGIYLFRIRPKFNNTDCSFKKIKSLMNHRCPSCFPASSCEAWRDAEGSFQISIHQNQKYKTGWEVSAKFQIGLHEKDRVILELIRLSLGVGTISKQGKDSLQFWVKSIKELEVIINQLDKYSLITQKQADFFII